MNTRIVLFIALAAFTVFYVVTLVAAIALIWGFLTH